MRRPQSHSRTRLIAQVSDCHSAQRKPVLFPERLKPPDGFASLLRDPWYLGTQGPEPLNDYVFRIPEPAGAEALIDESLDFRLCDLDRHRPSLPGLSFTGSLANHHATSKRACYGPIIRARGARGVRIGSLAYN